MTPLALEALAAWAALQGARAAGGHSVSGGQWRRVLESWQHLKEHIHTIPLLVSQ